MNPPVPSGTRSPVLSGTADPSYQEPKPAVSVDAITQNHAPNFSNQESFGFLLTPSSRCGSSSAAAVYTPLRDATMAVMP